MCSRLIGGNIRYQVNPRDVPPEKAARRLHLTVSQFDLVREDLFARGFPVPDATTGMYDLKAIDDWMDRRSGMANTLTADASPRNAQEVFDDRVRRLRNGQ